MVVAGEPGNGKTRLATELLTSLGDGVRALRGSCVPYGEGATYLPLRDAVGALTGAGDARGTIASLLADEPDAALVLERLTGVLAPEGAALASSDVAWAVRRLLEALAARAPVLLLLDDVHWAEPTLLDLVDYVTGWTANVPVVLVCLGRPEILEQRPEWAADAMLLGPLEADDARALLEALPESRDLDEAVREAVLATGEGNPLFLEQLATFAADGALREGAVPPTVEALLSSRLERLDYGERRVLEWAAVVGAAFTTEAVAELAADDERASVAPALLALVGRRLVRPDRGSVPSDDAYRFEHVLVRDVAYAEIPKAARAELHERLASWLDTKPDALDEIVGFHLEQAYRLRAELGDQADELAREAADRLGRAGRRAIARLDDRAAEGLLGRAVSLLPFDDEQHLRLEIERGYVLKNLGDMAGGVATLTHCADQARARGNRWLELRASIELAWPQLSDGSVRAAEILARVKDALRIFGDASDDYAVARAHHARAVVETGLLLHCAEGDDAATKANESYERAGVTRLCDVLLAQAWTRGPLPVPEAVERCNLVYTEPTTQRSILPYLDDYLAELEAMQARFASARDHMKRAAEAHRKSGPSVALTTTWAMAVVMVAQLAGDYAFAEVALVQAYEQLRGSEHAAWFATHAASLAGVRLAQGRVPEAIELATESADAAPVDDLLPQILWRQTRALAHVREGRSDEASELAREAVRLSAGTDALSFHADALLTQASVEAANGSSAVASEALESAIALYEQKQSVVGVQRAIALRDELQARAI
jgi:hypothetical protein